MLHNKKDKWSKRKRLQDALISNAYSNNTVQMLENISLLREGEFDSCKNILLHQAIKNGSKECALILISKGALCDPNDIMRDCDWDKLDKVHTLLIELIESDNSFIGKYTFWYTDKKSIISRLINPTKVNDNPKRVEYVMQLLRDKFFTAQDIREVFNTTYKDKPKNGNVLMIIRELTLDELGI